MSAGLCWRTWHPTPVLLPGKSHQPRGLVGYSPWGHEESDTTKWLHFHFSLPCIGAGNGNPLQCSCLKNPRNRGAWWAAICGVAELDTTEVMQQQQQRCVSSKDSKKNSSSFFPSFWWLLAVLGTSWPIGSSLQCLPLWLSSLCISCESSGFPCVHISLSF